MQNQGEGSHYREVTGEHFWRHRHGGNQSCNPHDGKGVKQVGTQNVAQGQIMLSFAGGNDG